MKNYQYFKHNDLRTPFTYPIRTTLKMDALLKEDKMTRKHIRHESIKDTESTRVRVNERKTIWHTQLEDF